MDRCVFCNGHLERIEGPLVICSTCQSRFNLDRICERHNRPFEIISWEGEAVCCCTTCMAEERSRRR